MANTPDASRDPTNNELLTLSIEVEQHKHELQALRRSLKRARIAAYAAIGAVVVLLVAMRWLPVTVGELRTTHIELRDGDEAPSINISASRQAAEIELRSINELGLSLVVGPTHANIICAEPHCYAAISP